MSLRLTESELKNIILEETKNILLKEAALTADEVPEAWQWGQVDENYNVVYWKELLQAWEAFGVAEKYAEYRDKPIAEKAQALYYAMKGGTFGAGTDEDIVFACLANTSAENKDIIAQYDSDRGEASGENVLKAHLESEFSDMKGVGGKKLESIALLLLRGEDRELWYPANGKVAGEKIKASFGLTSAEQEEETAAAESEAEAAADKASRIEKLKANAITTEPGEVGDPLKWIKGADDDGGYYEALYNGRQIRVYRDVGVADKVVEKGVWKTTDPGIEGHAKVAPEAPLYRDIDGARKEAYKSLPATVTDEKGRTWRREDADTYVTGGQIEGDPEIEAKLVLSEGKSLLESRTLKEAYLEIVQGPGQGTTVQLAGDSEKSVAAAIPTATTAKAPTAKAAAPTQRTRRIYLRGTRAEISALQTKIKQLDPAANLGKTGPNKDGVDGLFGNLTLAAWRKVTGRKDTPKTVQDAAAALEKTPSGAPAPTAAPAPQPAAQQVPEEVRTKIYALDKQIRLNKGAQKYKGVGRGDIYKQSGKNMQNEMYYTQFPLEDLPQMIERLNASVEKTQNIIKKNEARKRLQAVQTNLKKRNDIIKRATEELEAIYNKYPQAKPTTMAESRLHQIIKEETQNALKKNINEATAGGLRQIPYKIGAATSPTYSRSGTAPFRLPPTPGTTTKVPTTPPVPTATAGAAAAPAEAGKAPKAGKAAKGGTSWFGRLVGGSKTKAPAKGSFLRRMITKLPLGKWVLRLTSAPMMVFYSLFQDIYKVGFVGLDSENMARTFFGDEKLKRGLVNRYGLAYEDYMRSYISFIKSYDPKETDLVRALADLVSGGLFDFSNADPWAYISSWLEEVGWSRTISKQIYERMEARVDVVNKIVATYDPRTKLGDASIKTEELRKALMADMQQMLAEEYAMSNETGVNMPGHKNQNQAEAFLTIKINALVEATNRLWLGATNHDPETGEKTDATFTEQGGNLDAKAGVAASAGAAMKKQKEVSVEKANAALSENAKEELREAITKKLSEQNMQAETNEWFNYAWQIRQENDDMPAEDFKNQIIDVIDKWFDLSRRKLFENKAVFNEVRLITPKVGEMKYQDFTRWLSKNIKKIRVPKSKIRDLAFVNFVLDGQIEGIKTKKLEKRIVNLNKALADAQDDKDEKKIDKLEKKINKLQGRGERRAEKKKRVKVRKKDLKEIIEQEVLKVLDD